MAANDRTGGPAVTEGTLLGGRIRFRQPRRGYRTAIDPVFLAAAVPAQAGQRVLDVGAGTGAASLCLATRVPGCRIVGLELQPGLVTIAQQNIALNGLDGAVTVVEGNLLQAPPLGLADFDAVMANPPYIPAGGGTRSPDRGKATADAEGAADLEAWIGFCTRMARPGGHIVLIHRADRLDAILSALYVRRCGGILVFPLWPRAGHPARRVLVRARKGSRAPLVLAAGLTLHELGGNRYTQEAERILRGGAALPA